MNMTTYYVIRRGWNGANQSALYRPANPRDCFESGYYALVGIVEAETADEACAKCGDTVTVYNNQSLFAARSPRTVRGLTRVLAYSGG
jgi:hypothetical protein